jgi:hypothetical protein
MDRRGLMRARAIHEAGHSVIALDAGFKLEYVTLWNSVGDSGLVVDGLSSYNWLHQHQINPVDCLRRRTIAVFAGVLAVEAVCGDYDAWSSFRLQTDDLSKLEEILNSSGMCNETEADQWQKETWKECQKLVESRRGAIQRVAEALLRKGTLSGDEVEDLLYQTWCKTKIILILMAAFVAAMFFISEESSGS